MANPQTSMLEADPAQSTVNPTQSTVNPTQNRANSAATTVNPTQSTVNPTQSTVNPTQNRANSAATTVNPAERSSQLLRAPMRKKFKRKPRASFSRFPGPLDLRRYYSVPPYVHRAYHHGPFHIENAVERGASGCPLAGMSGSETN